MKKCLLGPLVLTVSLLLAACGNDKYQTSTEPADDSDSTEAVNNQSDKEELVTENTDEEVEENELLNVDLTDESICEEEWIAAYNAQEKLIDFEVEEVGYAWTEAESSGGISYYSYYALVTNTGKKAVQVYPNAVTFYNKDGSVAAVSKMGICAYPEVINEGEKSLIRTYEPATADAIENFDYAEADANLQLSVFDSTKLDTESPTI
ncbi:hypothetical protein ACTHQ4_04810 [Alkalicoccobacillus gibsonii]|uniref:hypothetical protein n=1 Tax=Alkalicoccobacillus gibsonii TaxID=79881 RepID=UPI003F7B806A